MRVAALINHRKMHQVPHVVPHVFALSLERPNWDVRILCSKPELEHFAREIGAGYPGHNVHFEQLNVPQWAHIIDGIFKSVSSSMKHSVLLHNLRYLGSFDALVVPEVTSLRYNSRKALKNTKMLYCSHGAGDPYGHRFGILNDILDMADMAIVVNTRIRDVALRLGRLQNMPYGVSGYVKYELKTQPPKRIFDNDRPTILYNPTQSAKKTSWTKFGPRVLDFFARSEKYNLIFAPHVVLFERPLRTGARLPKKWRDYRAEHMLIDLGSRASVDMSYLKVADLYLGDQSSQIYEFIQKPRPTAFINANGEDWQNNPDFMSWNFGPVTDLTGDFDARLEAALQDAFGNFETKYRPIQEKIAQLDCPKTNLPASTRGARIIADYLETGAVAEHWKDMPEA